MTTRLPAPLGARVVVDVVSRAPFRSPYASGLQKVFRVDLATEPALVGAGL